MVSQPAPTVSGPLSVFGDFRWLRAHISIYAVGVILLVGSNLLIGGSRLWSLTAIAIWSIFLFIHLLILVIARLSNELLADDDEEVVLLPFQDAVIVDPTPVPDPTTTWTTVEPADSARGSGAKPDEAVSWQIATDAAQARWKSDSAVENDNK